MADVINSCLDSIRQISEHIKDAILYLDAGCTEAFQYLGAFPLLLELGVRSVCSLENVSSLDNAIDGNSVFDHEKKIVVITSRLLSDAHRYILRCLSMHQSVRHCAIFTSISEIAHSAYADSPLGPDAFREYESLLLLDYEELVSKCEKKDIHTPRPSVFRPSEESTLNEGLPSEGEGWSKFSLSEEESPHLEASPRGKILDETNSMSCKEDRRQQLAISVHHFPMILCPLSPSVFVLPSEGSVAEACLSYEHEDSLGPGLPPISTGLSSDGEDTPGAILTAHFLYHLIAKMDLKMEIFSLGDLSKNIGKIMMDMSSLYDVGRRRRSAGLLLIDRTLDLLTPCCHGDTLVDRMFSSLPRRQRTSSLVIQHKDGPTLQRASLDVQIPLGGIFSKEEAVADAIWPTEGIEAFLRGWSSSDSRPQIADSTDHSSKFHDESIIQFGSGIQSGSLVCTETHQGVQYLDALLERRTKDGAILIKKWLEETLRKEKVSLNGRNRPNLAASVLQYMVKGLVKDQSSLLRNKGIIQLSEAAAFALSEPYTSRWDALASAERILSMSAGDTSQSLSAQIRDLINRSVLVSSHGQTKQKSESSQGLLTFQDVLLLAVIGYILAGENFPTSGSDGPFSWDEEHFLKEAVVDAVLENPAAAKLKFFHGIEGDLEARLNKKKSEKSKEDTSHQSNIDDFDDDQWGNWGDEDAEHNSEQVYGDMQLKLELRDRVDNLFKFFHKLSNLKKTHLMLRNGPLASVNDSFADPYSGNGLLYKLLTMVLGKYEVPGLEYHSSAVGRIFKSGFGRFGLGQAKPSLGDQSVILVFVVGGINSQEVLEVREALSQSGRPDVELIIGGTTLLTPNDMFGLLLGS